MNLLNLLQPRLKPRLVSRLVDGISMGGIEYPPVRDKLLIWANGQLQDGAYVWQDPDDVQDPDAPFGIWRKDKQVSPVEYSMKTSQSHCCTFNGVDDVLVLSASCSCAGDFTIAWSCAIDDISVNQRLVDSASHLDFIRLHNTWRISIAGVQHYFASSESTGTFVVTRVGSTLTLIVNGVSESIEGVSTDTYTADFIGAADGLGLYPLGGSLWDVRFQDVTIPMAEGYGGVVHDKTGTRSATFAGSGSLWSVYQDDYHYNVAKGFWMNGDGVKYPYPVSGFTSVHPAGKWNGAESKYEYRDEQVLIDADELEGEFFFTAGVVTPRTQAEIEAYCDGKASVFWSECGDYGQFSQYDEILTGSELVEAQDFNCL